MSDPRVPAEVVAQLTRLYKQAFDKGDLAIAEQISAMMRQFSDGSPVNVEMEKVGQGERLLLSEKWAEARDILASIDRSLLPDLNRPGVLNNLAYATSQAGDPQRGIELIVTAIEEADALGADYPQEKLAFLRSTHGISLSLAGKHEEAVSILAPIVEKHEAPARARTVRAYYLGQSCRALGRHEEATRALTLTASGEGPFVPRAQAALERG